MNPSKAGYLKDIFWRTVITLPKNFTGLITLPLLTHTYSQEHFAIWTQVFVMTCFFGPLLSFRLELAMVRYLSLEKNVSEIIRSVVTITMITSVVLLLVSLFGKNSLSYFFFGTINYAHLVFVSMLIAAFTALNAVFIGALRAQKEIINLSICEISADLWIVAIAVMAYLFKWPLEVFLWAYLAGSVLALIYLAYQLRLYNPFVLPLRAWSKIKGYMPFALPLMVNALFAIISRSIDRLLIAHMLSLEDLALYSVAAQFSSILLVVFSPINFVLLPHITKLWNDRKYDETSQLFATTSHMLFLLSLPATMGLTILAPDLICIIVGKNYSVTGFLILLLSLAALLQLFYQNNIYVMQLRQKTIYIPFLLVVGFLIHFLLGAALARSFGTYGIALAKVLSCLVMMSVATLWAHKAIKISYSPPIIFKVIIGSLAIPAVLYWIPSNNLVLLTVNVLIGVVLYAGIMFLLKAVRLDQLRNLAPYLTRDKSMLLVSDR